MRNDVRPINAHRFAEHLKDWQQDIENDYYIEPYKRSIISDTLQTAIEDLDDQPTIDAVPVVHARLKETGWDEAWCSWGDCTRCGHSNAIGSKYCNNCGAKMDGGAEE